jgi:hypothetical protein
MVGLSLVAKSEGFFVGRKERRERGGGERGEGAGLLLPLSFSLDQRPSSGLCRRRARRSFEGGATEAHRGAHTLCARARGFLRERGESESRGV